VGGFAAEDAVCAAPFQEFEYMSSVFLLFGRLVGFVLCDVGMLCEKELGKRFCYAPKMFGCVGEVEQRESGCKMSDSRRRWSGCI